MKKISLIEVNQPIGTFYIGVLSATDIFSIAEVKTRQYDPKKFKTFGGVQRSESPKRIEEIEEYCSDPDATFPTPIIIAVTQDEKCILRDKSLEFDENQIIGEIIDGQHRFKGLKNSGYANKFDIPVIFMFDLTEEEKAYVFSIINSKQTKVPMSLIYDLFELTDKRSPQKTCHEIARLLNSDKQSPFFNRLKMLGKKITLEASLSQGSFIRYLLPLISKNPDQDMLNIKNNKKLEDDNNLPLRKYFIEDKDEVIYKIIYNVFSALREVFEEEWNNTQDYILTKTTGYGAVLYALSKKLYFDGKSRNNLSKEYFKEQFIRFKQSLKSKELILTSEYFPSNEHVQKKLGDLIIESI